MKRRAFFRAAAAAACAPLAAKAVAGGPPSALLELPPEQLIKATVEQLRGLQLSTLCPGECFYVVKENSGEVEFSEEVVPGRVIADFDECGVIVGLEYLG